MAKVRFLIIFLITLVIGFLIIYWSVSRPFCANSISCKESLSLKVENDAIGTFNGQKIVPPKINLSQKEPAKKVLGEADQTGEKHIYVDLATQTLSAFQDQSLFMQVLVSTGKWFPTPTGDFTIWHKVRVTRMTGGEGADYYDLPNVPYVMFFSNSDIAPIRGFSFHGAYWHNNFGHIMSHGCVNMRIMDAQTLYDWVGEDFSGVKVTIYGQPI